jgi:ribosome-associated protein
MLIVSERVAIPEDELVMRFVRSPGPGGQNVNKVATAVELRYDIKQSRALPEPVRERLLSRRDRRITAEGVLVLSAHRHRTQERNRDDARTRLCRARAVGVASAQAARRDQAHAGEQGTPARRQATPRQDQAHAQGRLGPRMNAATASPVASVPELPPRAPRTNHPIARRLARLALRLFGWRVVGEWANEPRMVLLAAPHSSGWDAVWGLLAKVAMGVRIQFMAKKELFWWPLGPLLRSFGALPTDRSAAHGVWARWSTSSSVTSSCGACSRPRARGAW